MREVTHRGRVVDTSSRHSIAIQSTDDNGAAIAPSSPCTTVKYFYHAGEYWLALVPLDSVEEVFGQAFNFSKPRVKPGPNGPELLRRETGEPKRSMPFLTHVQSRFTLRPDRCVELYPLDGTTDGEPVHRVRDLVYTVEAVGPPGLRFNIRDGLSGNFLCAHRFLSIEEMVFERIVVQGQYVSESPPLRLNDADKQEVLRLSLLRSHIAGMREPYYLFRCCGTNNCTSNPFQIVDQVANYSLGHRIGSLLFRFPLSPRLYLRVRGLDSDRAVRKFVRDEFTEFIERPDVQRRKRAHVREKIRQERRDRARTRE